MFSYLKDIDALLNQRIHTIYKNIKSGSTSYYDSLGDFIDNFLKAVANKENFPFDENMSSGRLLAETKLKPFLIEKTKVDKKEHENLRNIVRFINEHKHDREKSLNSPENVINTLEPVFNIYFKVTQYYNPKASDAFDKPYIYDIFKSYEKEYNLLKSQIETLKNELTQEKTLTDKQYQLLKDLESKSVEFIDDEVLKDLSQTLVELKDVKIEHLIKKVDDITDLLIEQKENIRENRIISFATLSSIFGPTGKGFDLHIRNAIEVIESIGFENHIKNNREMLKEEVKQKEANLGTSKQLLEYLDTHIIEIQESKISNQIGTNKYASSQPNSHLLYEEITAQLISLFGKHDYKLINEPGKPISLTGFPLTDVNKQASLLLSSNSLSLNKVKLRFKII
ncbi:hypothetical protein [Paracholeplasma manati]|uniref:hypothetical protein n=1 Tax=Paracholeplasma manati TaxID=591373 RepID=UPI0024085397|nr:hypothetical protein [Paracholeplasma manati]MDG0889180.1 hypothetical protein [Paracholeplasma manati]